MCSVLGAISALASVGAGVMQAQAQQEAADAQAKSYERQAEVNLQNAKIKNRQQEQEADNAARETEQLKQRQRIIAGQNKAKFGAAGVSMVSGSPLDLLMGNYEAYEQDKETSLMNQRNRNYGLRVEESNFINEANANYAAADNTRSAAKKAVWGTILGTAASVAGSFAGMGGSGGSSSGGGSSYSAGSSGSNWTIGGSSDFLTASPSASYNSFNLPTSVSSGIGHNTTATWNMGSGYTFNTKNYKSPTTIKPYF